jgi:hypothetical protein
MQKQKIIEAEEKFIQKLVGKCTHQLTLQTNLKTYNLSDQKLEQKISLANGGMTELKPKLNRLLTGNGYRRKQHHLPIIVVSLEGTLNRYDRHKTLHYHLALGNFDIDRLDENFLEILKLKWIGTGIGTGNIHLELLILGREQGWGSYITKEAYKGNEQCIDFTNTQVPNHLLVN